MARPPLVPAESRRARGPVERLLSIDETAEVLRVSRRYVQSIISAGELASVRLGPRCRRIEPDALRAFLAERTEGAA
jgi:excisionase family DNA binding protein